MMDDYDIWYFSSNMQTIPIVKKYFLFFLILIFTLIVMCKLTGFVASAISPSLSLHVMNDSRNDWIDWTKKYPFERDGSIDIIRADYFSNGKTLNATIWLACQPGQSSHIDSVSQCNKNNIQISVEDLRSKNITLNEYTDTTVNKINKSFGIQIQSSEDAILADNPAHSIMFILQPMVKPTGFQDLSNMDSEGR